MKLTLKPLSPENTYSARICEYPAAIAIIGEITHAEDVAIRDEVVRRVNAHDALVQSCRVGADWLSWWLNKQECECESGHSCGYNERFTELEAMHAALALAAASETSTQADSAQKNGIQGGE